MTASKTLRGKCPRCCPDGGACFERQYDGTKKCNNCHLIVPMRKVKSVGETLSPSQRRVIDRVVAAGWTLEKQEWIGRKAWVVFKHPTRGWFLGDSVYGSIGPNGRIDLKLQRLGPEKVMRDDIDLDVYMDLGGRR